MPRGRRPDLGGAPALNVEDLPGVIAAGCAFNAGGAPAPCSIVAVLAGACPTVVLGGAPAVSQALVCATSSGAPTHPVAQAGQTTVHGA